MQKEHKQLLTCLAAFAAGKTGADLIPDMGKENWETLWTLAGSHKLEAVVYDTLGRNPGFCGGDAQMICQWRQRTYRLIVSQNRKQEQLLKLTAALEKADVPYALVKGAVCRDLYQRGDLRVSADEDLYIPLECYDRASAVLTGETFVFADGRAEDVTNWYHKDSGLHIELHCRLFSDSQTQAVFAKITPWRAELKAGTVYTLPPAQHLAFLLCHARKHLITGGVGIRTLCDIALFYRTYREQLQEADSILQRLDCSKLLQQVLAIGRDVLQIPCQEALPPYGEDLLLDVLDAGVYGQSSMTRRHSGTLTLQQAEGKENWLRMLFPTRQEMQARYPQLQEHPGRLPLFWLKRIGSYTIQTLSEKNNSPAASLQLGKKRTEMLVKYEIIEKPSGKNK